MSPVIAQRRAQTAFATNADSQATSRLPAPITKWNFLSIGSYDLKRERVSPNHYLGHNPEMICSLS